MDTGIVFVKTVRNSVMCDCCQWSQVGHVGPKAIKSGQVTGMKLAGFGGVEVLFGIVCIPKVYICNLRPMCAHNAKHLPCRNAKRPSIARRNLQCKSHLSSIAAIQCHAASLPVYARVACKVGQLHTSTRFTSSNSPLRLASARSA